MADVSYYRERANHLRHLAEMTWQHDLKALLGCLAQEYDETAEDLEGGASEIRHPELVTEVEDQRHR